jgi:hypothetical protein
MKIRSIAAKLAVLAGLAIGSTASASTVYPGIQCVPVTGSTGTFSIFGGTVRNTASGADLNVTCPLDHTATAGTITGSAFVYDRNTGVTLACTLVGETANTSSITFTGNTVNAGASTNRQQLSFSSGVTGQYFYASCLIPRTLSGAESHVAYFDIN